MIINVLKQPSLLDAISPKRWPPADRFPLNVGQKRVEEFVKEDLAASSRYLVITGYSSLEHLVSFFGSLDLPNRRVTIVLGHELDAALEDPSQPWPAQDLAREIWNFWLKEGFSITLCGALIRFLSALREGQIQFYLGSGLHAKIYLGEQHAILGSSNFSRAGLRYQREANCRFPRSDPRYEEVRLIAENYLAESRPYQDEMIALLEKLLRYARWQEVLAQAVVQIMEEEWLNRYEDLRRVLAELKLWPSQRQAVAQALWVLDNHGSVLLADPTGAGKTRVGLALLRALQYRFLARQQFRRAVAGVVCPPGVQDQWDQEALEEAGSALGAISQGLLSVAGGEARKRALNMIRRANILLIDEAHNYLSRGSRRSQTIQLHAQAEHVILMTATPLNRGVEDLLRLMEVLGLDNLSDEALSAYYEIRRAIEQKAKLSPENYQKLKRYVQVFTVRRTKRELNRLIQQEPEAYRDRFGRLCRFPKEISLLYQTRETERDRALAREIDALAQGLVGLVWLRKTLRDLWAGRISEPRFLAVRLAAASALARYNIKAMLRSSRAALIEHLEGTAAAQEYFGLKGKLKEATGDVLSTLSHFQAEAKAHFRPPSKAIEAPVWLQDQEALGQILDQERQIYQRIAVLAREISDARERGKVQFVKDLFQRHRLILAYDSRLITLAYFQRLFQEMGPEIYTLLVTGSRRRERERIKRLFCLGSQEKNVVALCSDAVSEGVNLQQASAVVFFDLPSVVRLAEQRIGRIERLDSPHPEVEIYWPNDSPEFCVATDRRLVERHLLVENILGSNIRIPEDFLAYAEGYQEEAISGKLMLEIYEKEKAQAAESFWDDLADAFQPVRELMASSSPLISQDLLAEIRQSDLANTTLLSAVQARTPWCFLCLRGDSREGLAPQWIFLELGERPITDISLICQKLRTYLAPDSQSVPWSFEADRWLSRFLEQLKQSEFFLLPPRRRRALKLLEDLLRSYRRRSRRDEKRRCLLDRLLLLLKEPATHGVDLLHLSQLWLDLLTPLFETLIREKRRPVRLRDLKPYLLEKPLPNTSLERLLKVQRVEPLEKRILSCLLGMV